MGSSVPVMHVMFHENVYHNTQFIQFSVAFSNAGRHTTFFVTDSASDQTGHKRCDCSRGKTSSRTDNFVVVQMYFTELRHIAHRFQCACECGHHMFYQQRITKVIAYHVTNTRACGDGNIQQRHHNKTSDKTATTEIPLMLFARRYKTFNLVKPRTCTGSSVPVI
jgi:hypothetical protein